MTQSDTTAFTGPAGTPQAQRSATAWLSTKEAARQLGITTRTLYRLIDAGQLPAYKFGRVIRLRQDEVVGFVEGARIKPGELEHLYSDAAQSAGHDSGQSA